MRGYCRGRVSRKRLSFSRNSFSRNSGGVPPTSEEPKMGLYPFARVVYENEMTALVRILFVLARLAGTSLAVVALSAPARVAAAEPTPAEVAVARRLFQDAVELEQRGDWSGAEAKLREAIALKDTPGLRYHLAYCEERQGRLVEAMIDYDRAAEMIATGVAAPDVDALLEPAREALRERTPTVRLDVHSDVDAPSVNLDAKAVSPTLLGHELPVDPGPHTLEVIAPGRAPWRRQFEAAETARLVFLAELELAPAPKPVAVAPTISAEPERGAPLRAGVLVGEAAVTVGGIGLALIGHANRQSAVRDIESIDRSLDDFADEQSIEASAVCNQPRDAVADLCTRRTQAVDDRNGATTLRTAGLIVGGVGAAALVTTWFVWPANDATSAARPLVYPVVGGWAVACGGTF